LPLRPGLAAIAAIATAAAAHSNSQPWHHPPDSHSLSPQAGEPPEPPTTGAEHGANRGSCAVDGDDRRSESHRTPTSDAPHPTVRSRIPTLVSRPSGAPATTTAPLRRVTATATMLQHADASRAHDRRPSSTTSEHRAHRRPVPLLHGCQPPGPPPAHVDQSDEPHPARSQHPNDAPRQTAADRDTHAVESRALRTALRVTARRSAGGPEHSSSHVRLIHQEPSSGPRRQHERPSRIRNGPSSTPAERLSASTPPSHGVTSRGSPHTATAPRPPSRSSTRQRRPRRARPCARTGSSAPATRRPRTP